MQTNTNNLLENIHRALYDELPKEINIGGDTHMALARTLHYWFLNNTVTIYSVSELTRVLFPHLPTNSRMASILHQVYTDLQD